jgi:pyruvate/2-oxoglutarate dehydrogenase complex dihydrolipoamide acyltransferase (E2) component
MRRLLPLAALPLLAACADDGLRVFVGDRLVYADARAQAADAAASGAPVAAAPAGAPAATAASPAAAPAPGWRFPTFTTNIPVYVGDRMISPGTGGTPREDG